MSYASCPTASVNSPAAIVWALLMEPAGWENVFAMRVTSVDPPGPAVVGQTVCGQTGLRILHLKFALRMIEINTDQHRLRMDVDLPFGLFAQEDLRCPPLDDAHSRVDYRCDFGFPKGWLGTLMRGLLNEGSTPARGLAVPAQARGRTALRRAEEWRRLREGTRP